MSVIVSKIYQFEPGAFSIASEPGAPTPNASLPYPCDEHAHCFKAKGECSGRWSMNVPLDVQTYLAGKKQKLVSVSLKLMRDGDLGWGLWLWIDDVYIRVDGSVAQMFEYNDTSPSWTSKIFGDVGIDLSLASQFDVQLVQKTNPGPPSTYLAMHTAYLKASFEYIPNVLPPTGDVEILVRNRNTAAPINGADVELLSGNRVVADQTSVNGKVTFAGVYYGDYTVQVIASGCAVLNSSITVDSAFVSGIASMVPLPPAPYEQYLIPGAILVAVLGGVFFLSGRAKGGGGAPVYVIK